MTPMHPRNPSVSVIIPTHNRAASLSRTLASIVAMRVDGLRWELLVVDNASQDATRAVVEEWAGRLPVRYLYEPELGRSHALNTGIDAANADLLVFTDDDVLVDPNWLSELWSARYTYPDAAAFGGRILPVWPKGASEWYIRYRDAPGWYGIHDWGADVKE